MPKKPEGLAQFDHMDGRVCTFLTIMGDWYHFDHPGDEPGPRDVVSYRCERQHPGDSSQLWTIPKDIQPPDRGEFGMPTLGRHSLDIDWQLGPGSITPMPRQAGKTAQGNKVQRVRDIIDEAQEVYTTKAAGYKGVEGDTADHLGVKGQFADINRKFWRIKAMLWDEVVPAYPDAGAGESAEEILMDFIGHAALTIDYLRQAQDQKAQEKFEGKGRA